MSLIINENNLPPFDLVLRTYINHYLTKLGNHLLPNTRWKWAIFVIEILHLIIGSSLFTLGLLLPPDYMAYNILMITVVVVGWEVLGYCLITKIIAGWTGENREKIDGELSNDKEARFLIPFTGTFLKLYGMLIIGLSLFFHLKPHLAPYTIITKLVGFIYNKLRLSK